MQVRGTKHKNLNAVLADAFTRESMTQMLQRQLGVRYDHIIRQSNFDYEVFDLIEHFNRADRVQDLVAGARAFNQTHQGLYEIAFLLGIGTKAKVVEDTQVKTEKKAKNLERLVNARIPMLASRQLIEDMMTVDRQVCLIEVKVGKKGRALGSGFLIGPSTVLTNYHVVSSYLGPDQVDRLQVRFDASAVSGAGQLRPERDGTVFGVEGIPIYTPPASAEYSGNFDSTPAPNELDFAILQLDDDAGEELVGQMTAGSAQLERGYIVVPTQIEPLEANDPLIIYQYPNGTELKVAFDTQGYLRTQPHGLRMRYRNNTEPGSSGSPVFNVHWQLVALHHAGEPSDEPVEYNQGIPVVKIREYVEAQGHNDLFG